ncbi:2-hydroxyacid dehydrogenase [Paracoccus saliphilus]|uniref:2-hydroxyacid dehydrogenase n=1 Tax=Paracoccus saliphilus TaxID=405559 RepID=A0AA46A5E5_9RHOB|nr:2-hydroxyacid dehydrogenase [Paracoccus saliphilus]WCR04325.1 2-hydroxyacid dehydrogenase [Paracoccus saliphilus]SIS79568.1 Lactate dehydrogenase [Paracoccus saliphilus]
MSLPRILSLAKLEPQDVADRLTTTYQVIRDIAAATDVEVVLTTGGLGLSAKQMAALPALRLIAVNGVGVDAVDLPEARRRGIAVTTTPDVLSLAVAEMALGLALAAGRRIAEGDRFIRSGAWADKNKLPLGMSVLERRAGILGYGRIGRKLADLLRGMGMEVLYTARSEKPGVPDSYRPDPLSLARDCDLLFVTAAGGAENRGLVDAEILTALGPRGVVVNVARGPVVETAALAHALQSGQIAGAGLDVFDDEPNVPPSLLEAPNCVLAPHIGSATTEARRAMAQLVLDNIDAYFAGRPLPTPYEQG